VDDNGAAKECFICDKHRSGDDAQGGVLYQDDLVYAGHVHTMGGTTAYRGYLMVEPLRHVPGLGELTDEEAARLGWLANRLARVLKELLGAEHVYAFVLGGGTPSRRSPPHLHLHLAPRYPGTPQEYWGQALSRWPGAPRVHDDGMRVLITQLRAALEGPAPA
jgi:diadenosine tetraphosphate (Ap4A) HIT family hydrolase